MRKSYDNFGPWTTSLSDQPGVGLSTFWRQRLSRLVSGAGSPKRLSRWALAALVMIAVGVALAPTMRLSGAAEETPTVDDPLAVIEAESERPYVHRFSNGAEIELIGLSVNPSREQPWWRPDGSPLGERPYDDVRAVMSDRLPREVCFRWKNLPADDYTVRWHTLPPYSGAGGGPFAGGEQLTSVSASAFSFSEDLEACTFTFTTSVDTTPWETSFDNDARGNHAAMGSQAGGVIFGPVREEDEGTSIVVSYQVPGRAVRLIAIDTNGATHRTNQRSGGGVMGFTQAVFHFPGVRPEELDRFELQTQTRILETVHFRNVSLHAGKLTNVEIVPVVEEAERVEAATPVAAEDPLGLGLYPMRDSMRADPPADWDQRRAKLYGLINELTAAMAADPRGQLANGEVLKFIPADIDWPAVHELRRLHQSDQRPAWLRMHGTDDGLSVTSWSQGDQTVADVLDRVVGVKLHRLDVDVDILAHNLNGDWILARDPREPHEVSAQEVAAVEAALREHLEPTVRLEFKTVDRPVYVAQGDFRDDIGKQIGNDPTQLAVELHMPASRTKATGSVAQTFPELLELLGELLLTPIVDEVKVQPNFKGFFVMFDGPQASGLLQPLDAEVEARVVAAFQEQTGLTLKLESRPVEMLFITRD